MSTTMTEDLMQFAIAAEMFTPSTSAYSTPAAQFTPQQSSRNSEIGDEKD
ncbi:hypothetical protein GLAREA_06888 [Glarea lozoyensis ATCC 20868]|uniref:Uncharacterized protein n=1 Tax=Glarea lozoyensis (strain ATCC 20868 / MF5171) TaxID=1116229 RepID=S3D807_GLAL2|nr:uncharacterized protein GLAREA_06888 [Glarea lozoyensis ATCC 20868]EPE33875.1 hypothetical protein GLAREA_06888 [Glarea lozoyensis ATCC 20868]